MAKTKTFVQLIKLTDLWTDDERWQANVKDTGVQNGYAIGCEEDGCEIKDFALSELEFAEAEVYDFMGSAYEDERFYARDIDVFKDKATGRLWVQDKEDLYAF